MPLSDTAFDIWLREFVDMLPSQVSPEQMNAILTTTVMNYCDKKSGALVLHTAATVIETERFTILDAKMVMQ